MAVECVACFLSWYFCVHGVVVATVCLSRRFMVTMHYVWHFYTQMVVNIVVCVVLLVAKLPEMMGVRLLGKKKSTSKLT